MTPINVALCTIRPLLSMALLKQIPPRAGQLSEGGAKLYVYRYPWAQTLSTNAAQSDRNKCNCGVHD